MSNVLKSTNDMKSSIAQKLLNTKLSEVLHQKGFAAKEKK